jgi:hypothetical protein
MPESETDHSFILLYVASSGSIAALDKGNEFECRLARARGKSEVIRTVDDDSVDIVASERGYVVTQSGFMMEFIDPEDTHLPILDVAKMGDRRAYRVPTEAVESLPSNVLARLERNEFVRIHGQYDPETGTFSGIGLGWDVNEKNPWDLLLDEIGRRDEVNPVIDYWAVEYGPDHWNPETIAQKRGIQTKTVRENVHRIKADLNDDDVGE